MEATITLTQPNNTRYQSVQLKNIGTTVSSKPGVIEKTIVWWGIKLRIFYFACLLLKRPLDLSILLMGNKFEKKRGELSVSLEFRSRARIRPPFLSCCLYKLEF